MYMEQETSNAQDHCAVTTVKAEGIVGHVLSSNIE